MMEAVIMPSILYNIEAYPSIRKEEMAELESIQGKVLNGLLEVPQSTPYMGILMETGIWTMEAKYDYKKLMLYHRIVNSDKHRIMKKMLDEQTKWGRRGTWYDSINKIMYKYNIKDNTREALKSEWKKMVKAHIKQKTEEIIRESCKNMSKCRTICNEEYSMKDYMKECTSNDAIHILRMRLHMVKLPCNYKNNKWNERCRVCGEITGIKTEHYFVCSGAVYIRKRWNITINSLTSNDIDELKRASQYIKAIEKLEDLEKT